jgi:polar amino acid transport system substrate-binding protein
MLSIPSRSVQGCPPAKGLRMAYALSGLIASLAFLPSGLALAQGQPPLKCGIDGTLAPHAMVKLDGTLEGFQVDLFKEMAKRMGRELVIENGEHTGMIPALLAKRYDFLCGPITVTADRSKSLLFTEPYLWSEWRFIVKSDAKLTSEEDLKGKTIAVQRGTPNEKWLKDNSERLKLEVLSFPGQSDAVQAVIQGRAFGYTNGGSEGTFQYVAQRAPGVKVAEWVIPDTRSSWAAPLRKDSAELRKQVEDTIACMKKDGTLAKISEKWFGKPPSQDAAQINVYPGYGTEGFEGYDPSPQKVSCD